MQARSLVLGVIAVTVAMNTGCQQGQSSAPRRAPEFFLTAAKGIDPKVKLADFRGKWLLIDFWGHW